MNPSSIKNMLRDRQDDICRAVMSRIVKRRRRDRQLALIAYGFVFVLSTVVLVPAWQYATERAVASGFADYLSLLASDGLSLIGSWHALLLSLAESAPLWGITMCLGLSLLLIYSIRQVIQNINDLRYYTL